MFPSRSVLRRGGSSSAVSGRGRLEDRFQFKQFVLICYAYKLTDDRKYLDAALKHADALRKLQNPADNDGWMGAWPHNFHSQKKPPEEGGGRQSEPGYMLNDFATTASMRTMIMAYKLTADEKYIDRIERLPEYMLSSNVGMGNVRGWRGQTDAYDRFTWHRGWEGSLIDPRNFNRFAAPMMTYFAAVTGKNVYLNMVEEGYNWLRSVERKGSANYPYGHGMSGSGGWAYKYTFDGREAWTMFYRNLVRPDFHMREKVWLDATKQVLKASKEGVGVANKDRVEALREWLGDPQPVEYNKQKYLKARLAAARRVTDENLEVYVSPGIQKSWKVENFLDRVRERPAKPSKLDIGGKWVWGFRRTPGWAAWQYVWDVRLALGKIDPDTAAWGGRGLSLMSTQGHHLVQPGWDALFDLPSIAVESRSWLDLPLNDTIVPVEGVELKPKKMRLGPGETREIKVKVKPDDATLQTGVWRVEPANGHNVCWIEPDMEQEIDPTKQKAVYTPKGKIEVHAGLPGSERQAKITFTTTDGHHVGTCKVRMDPNK